MYTFSFFLLMGLPYKSGAVTQTVSLHVGWMDKSLALLDLQCLNDERCMTYAISLPRQSREAYRTTELLH